jgi:hypothetical protein
MAGSTAKCRALPKSNRGFRVDLLDLPVFTRMPKRWATTREQKLERALKILGHDVLLVNPRSHSKITA